MTPYEAFHHCLRCGSLFTHKGGNHLKCVTCGFNFFVNPAPCTSAIITNENNEVLLAKRKFDPYKGTWQTPGGFMQPDETPRDALKRELEEEIGMPERNMSEAIYLRTLKGIYPYQEIELPFIAMYYHIKTEMDLLNPQDDVEELAWVGLDQLANYTITYDNLAELIREVLTFNSRSYKL